MLRAARLALAAALPAAAHMVSISTGEAIVEGARLRYEIRMPLFELEHIREPQKAIFAKIRFSSGGAEGRLGEPACELRREEQAYVCRAAYEFPAPVEVLAVESRLHEVTVPQHVHLIEARMDGKSDRAVLEFSFPSAELRFRPATGLELAVKAVAGGVTRAVTGLPQLLFLLVLALAARSRQEVASLLVMFILGQAVALHGYPLLGRELSVPFVQTACTLTVAYLLFEIVLLPRARGRWAVAGVLGLFHGVALALFARSSLLNPACILGGAATADTLLVLAFKKAFNLVNPRFLGLCKRIAGGN